MVTYRLHDALPVAVVQRLEGYDRLSARQRQRVEAFLDAGHGSCLLGRSDIASLVVENWRHFNEKLYLLLAWVVMPNHVHVLLEVEAEASLGRIVHAWKSYTAKAIARVAQVSPPIWQADYWDRLVRDDQHLAAALDYIQSNPVKAGLVSRAEDWLWSSARNN